MPRKHLFYLLALLAFLLSMFCGCESAGTSALVSIVPVSVTLALGGQQQFKATVTVSDNTKVSWSVSPSGGGSITDNGLYTAPSHAGVLLCQSNQCRHL